VVMPYSGRIRLTSIAAGRISQEDYDALTARARELGVTAGAIYSSRNGWCVSVTAARRVELRGKGALSAVLGAALDDFEEAE
jgi:hypothetical protein